MQDHLRLTMMTFPQHWDGIDTLTLNVVLLPGNDPLADPLIGADPAVLPFARRTPNLEVRVDAGLTARPATAGSIRLTSKVTSKAPDPVAGFTALSTRVTAAGTSIGTVPAAARTTRSIRKALPASYLAAGGDGPDGITTTSEDEFGRALRCETSPTPVPDVRPPKPPVTWGEVISYAIRQPEVATWLGLRYSLEVTLAPSQITALTAGGYLFATVSDADPWAVAAAAAEAAMPPAHPLRVHAARVPPLEASGRPLFGAVQFHVDSTVTASLDAAVATAETYADGFAKVVHCDQPSSAEPTVDQGRLAPGCDLGLQIGWEDHQVVAWLNDALALLAARRAGTLVAAEEQPLGVLGYRVDVADITPPAAAGLPSWQSLVDVTAELGPPFGTVRGESCVAPVPAKPRVWTDNDDAWLPRYFATWRGGSLCERDDVPRILSAKGHPAPAAPTRVAAGLTTLLSYGHTYAFRVRLCDLSGGGPAVADTPVEPPPSTVATHGFRRHVPPKAPGVARVGPDRTPDALVVTRPMITYPEVLYTALGATQAARDAIRSDLLVQARGPVPPEVAGLPDPDVDGVDIEVAVRGLMHDPSNSPGPFVAVYTTRRMLAAPTGAAPLLRDGGTRIDLDYVEVPDLSTWVAPVAMTGPVAIPRGRDVRITVMSSLRRDAGSDYIAEPARRCLGAGLEVRCEPALEPALLVRAGEQPPIRALRFRRPPDVAAPPVIAQLAETLGLAPTDDGLCSPPGHRTVFAASAALRHRISADGEQLHFTAPTELLRNWVVAIVVDLARDWTWDALVAGRIDVRRGGAAATAATASSVGTITLPRVVGPLAADAAATEPHRGATRLVFLDAVDPHEAVAGAPGTFPQCSTHTWFLAPARTPAGPPSAGVGGGSELSGTVLRLTLPIGIPPTQVPALASVGVAASQYVAGPGYASTEPRRRGLWLELAAPVANAEGDALFVRVLAHGADPLLYAAKPTAAAPIEPPLSLDTELVRVVLPNATDDRSGEDAMMRLTPSPTSDRHFLLPRPPAMSPEDPELFGFYSYELRIGHSGAVGDPRWWSTASARFGAPRRVVGVQHPPPTLVCHGARRRLRPTTWEAPAPVGHRAAQLPQRLVGRFVTGPELIVVTAPYATPSHAGTPVVAPEEVPLTQLWFCLYAQVAQVDATAMRNVLLLNVPGTFLSRRLLAADPELTELFDGHRTTRHPDRTGFALFPEGELGALLETWHLPRTAPLSALAVELLPPGTGTSVGFNRHRPSDSPLLHQKAPAPPGAGAFPFGRLMRVSPLTPIKPLC